MKTPRSVWVVMAGNSRADRRQWTISNTVRLAEESADTALRSGYRHVKIVRYDKAPAGRGAGRSAHPAARPAKKKVS